jgi:hypothetical protein
MGNGDTNTPHDQIMAALEEAAAAALAAAQERDDAWLADAAHVSRWLYLR